jgi:hypothetical protein
MIRINFLIIVTISLIIGVNACKPKVDFDFDNATPTLVIWSVLHPDSIVSAFLSKTSSPLNKNVERRISGGSIVLFENDIAIDTLKEDSTGFYKSRKGTKPSVGKIYHIIATKGGFNTIKTPKDTMPAKPIIFKTTFEDSVRKQQTLTIARITVLTNQPSHFENYGFGLFRTTGYPWQSDTVQGGFFNTSGSPFREDGITTCENNGIVPFLGFSFMTPSCKSSETKYELYNSWIVDERYVKKVKFHFKVGAITYKSIEILKSLYNVAAQYGDYYSGINIFWSPITLPDYIENGYGFFACYNTTDVTVSAR